MGVSAKLTFPQLRGHLEEKGEKRKGTAQGEEKGTGYFSDRFAGRPRFLRVDSNTSAAAMASCQSPAHAQE